MYVRDGKGKVVDYTGVIFELVKDLGLRLNFRYQTNIYKK